MSHAPEQLTMWSVGAPPELQAQWARCALATGSRLLAPLRDAVDRAQKEARASLDAMDDDCKGTMAWDSCEDAIEHLELCWLYNCRSDVKENLWNAEGRREGYDTWDRAALAQHVTHLRRLLAALTTLIGTLNHLSRREAEELSANASDNPRPLGAVGSGRLLGCPGCENSRKRKVR